MCIAYILGKGGGGKMVEWGATMGGGPCPQLYS